MAFVVTEPSVIWKLRGVQELLTDNTGKFDIPCGEMLNNSTCDGSPQTLAYDNNAL